MLRNLKLARDLGLLHIPDANVGESEDAERLDPAQVCVVCTGSQGEFRSALWQMVEGQSRYVSITADDTVVFSSHPIPGNEASVARLRNGLARRGAEVVHSGQADVHTSGHAKQDELADFHAIVKPEFFVPVHGEYMHLAAHAKLAQRGGMAAENVVVCVDGESVVLSGSGIEMGPTTSGAMIYVDGRVGGVDEDVLQERLLLGTNGFVAVFVVVDPDDGSLVDAPSVTSRGWAIDDDLDVLEDAIADGVRDALRQLAAEGAPTRENVERAVRRRAGTIVADRTRRRPMIVPVVTFAH
jgi:ribonuclease J